MKLNFGQSKLQKFTAEDKDVIEAGVDLYKHFLYINKGKKEFAEFADITNKEGKKLSLSEKEETFTKTLVNESIKRAGLGNSNFSQAALLSNPQVRWAQFALISEMLDVIIPETILDDFYRFAEVKNGAFGDNFVFHIPNPGLFVVSQTADGMRKGTPQRLYNSDLVVTPINRIITIQEDFMRVIAGQVNWGDWVTRVALSFETQLTIDMYNALIGTYTSGYLTSDLQAASFDQKTFIAMAQKVTALNNGAPAMAFGTKNAISNILPTDEYFRMALGADYNTYGYLANFHGVDIFEIPQKVLAGTTTFAIDDNTIYIASMGVDRPIKVCFEGETLSFSNDNGVNADMTIEQTIMKKYQVAVATSSYFGIVKTA